jgi:6-phosphogluconolactonase (cycloisomerase 2 family)
MAFRERRRIRTGRRGLLCVGVAVALCAPAAASGAAADRFVYVSNGLGGSQNVSAMRIGANGGLTSVAGSPFASGSTTQEGLALTPDGAHLYVASFGTNAVKKFNVAPAGGLSGLATFTTGFTSPLGVAPDPDNRWLFTWNHGQEVNVSTISNTGVLSNIVGSPFALPNDPPQRVNPFAGSVTPDGDNLYTPVENNVPGGAPEVVVAWAVNQISGALTPIQTIASGNPAVQSNPFGSAVTPDGRFLYVSNPEDGATGSISGFTINANGTLTVLPGLQSLSTSPGNHPLNIAITPDGEHLYVATRITATVNAYTIGANGSLTPVPGQPFATGGTPDPNGACKALAVTPDGSRLYVSCGFTDDEVNGFNINPNGSLSQLPGSGWPTGGTEPDLEAIAITPNQGPTASFTVTPGFAGQPTGFNAGSSTDDGDIVRYSWDFGDGTVLPDGGPIPNHIYAAPGTYNARLLVTDDEGCSDERIFTGKATLCNATADAVQTTSVTVNNAPPPPAPETFARQLTIKYQAKKNRFKGKITSNEADCIDGEKVTVFRKKKGPDKKLGSKDTDANGKWKLKQKNADGKFYATVGETVLPDDDVCLAVQSKKTKVG